MLPQPCLESEQNPRGMFGPFTAAFILFVRRFVIYSALLLKETFFFFFFSFLKSNWTRE